MTHPGLTDAGVRRAGLVAKPSDFLRNQKSTQAEGHASAMERRSVCAQGRRSTVSAIAAKRTFANAPGGRDWAASRPCAAASRKTVE
jgi:hypothetical protein